MSVFERATERGIGLGRRTCECGHSYPMFRCRGSYEGRHEAHYWPAKASTTTFYCDGKAVPCDPSQESGVKTDGAS